MKLTYTEVRSTFRGPGKRYEVKVNGNLVGYVENEKFGWANNWHTYDVNGKHIALAGYTRKEATEALIEG